MKTLFILAATTSLIAPLLESFAKANNIHCERITRLDADTNQRIRNANGFVVDADNTQLIQNVLMPERSLHSHFASDSRTSTLYAPTPSAIAGRKLIVSLSHAIDAASRSESKELTIVKDFSAGWDSMLHSIMTSDETKTLLTEKGVTVSKVHLDNVTSDTSNWPETMFASIMGFYSITQAGHDLSNNLATTTGYMTEHGTLLLSATPGVLVGIANYCELNATSAISDCILNNIQTVRDGGNEYITNLYKLNSETYGSLWKSAIAATASA